MLSGTILDLLTAAMFGLFAVLLWRSAPDSGRAGTRTDGGAFAGGELDIEIPFVD